MLKQVENNYGRNWGMIDSGMNGIAVSKLTETTIKPDSAPSESWAV